MCSLIYKEIIDHYLTNLELYGVLISRNIFVCTMAHNKDQLFITFYSLLAYIDDLLISLKRSYIEFITYHQLFQGKLQKKPKPTKKISSLSH